MNQQTKLVALGMVVIIGAGLFFIFSDKKQEERPKIKVGIEKLKVLEKSALEFQTSKKWCEAKQKWEEMVKHLEDARNGKAPDDAKQKWAEVTNNKYAEWRQRAKSNLHIVNDLCGKKSETGEVEVSKPDNPPKTISEEDIVKYYRKGKSIKSVAILNISGRGVNQDWGIQGEAHFQYFSHIVTRTTVEDKAGEKVTFIVEFPQVDQTRFVRKKEFQLNLPDSPMLSTLGTVADDKLKLFPQYFVARKMADLFLLVDPNLKRTLTSLGNSLDLSAGEDLEIATKLDKLSGAKFRMVYKSEWGVISIKDLNNSGLFDKAELISLARQSSLLMDYFILPNKDKEGEWTVRAEDIGNLLSIGYDTETSGIIKLNRDKANDVKEGGNTIVKLTVTKGAIQVQGEGQEANINIRKGNIIYSLNDLMTRKSKMEFKAETIFRSQDHLLFGAERLRDLDINATYEAEVISAGE